MKFNFAPSRCYDDCWCTWRGPWPDCRYRLNSRPPGSGHPHTHAHQATKSLAITTHSPVFGHWLRFLVLPKQIWLIQIQVKIGYIWVLRCKIENKISPFRLKIYIFLRCHYVLIVFFLMIFLKGNCCSLKLLRFFKT